jgi:hypothetical protein
MFATKVAPTNQEKISASPRLCGYKNSIFSARSLDEAKRNPGMPSRVEKPRFTEYFHVFCPSGQQRLFKFDPIEFSPLRCIRATI